MSDYEAFRLIWWVLIGVLFIGFAITDGFDMGVGALVPLIGKTDIQRRVMINSIAPHWDGNQVWLVIICCLRTWCDRAIKSSRGIETSLIHSVQMVHLEVGYQMPHQKLKVVQSR